METTAALMERETRLIDGLRELVARYIDARDLTRSEDAIVSLAAHLRERISLEERILFPAVEQVIGDKQTRRMRRQHEVLLKLVSEVERSLRAGAIEAASYDLRELEAALRTHLEEERDMKSLWQRLSSRS
jgi:hypothetical protein